MTSLSANVNKQGIIKLQTIAKLLLERKDLEEYVTKSRSISCYAYSTESTPHSSHEVNLDRNEDWQIGGEPRTLFLSPQLEDYQLSLPTVTRSVFDDF